MDPPPAHVIDSRGNRPGPRRRPWLREAAAARCRDNTEVTAVPSYPLEWLLGGGPLWLCSEGLPTPGHWMAQKEKNTIVDIPDIQ